MRSAPFLECLCVYIENVDLCLAWQCFVTIPLKFCLSLTLSRVLSILMTIFSKNLTAILWSPAGTEHRKRFYDTFPEYQGCCNGLQLHHNRLLVKGNLILFLLERTVSVIFFVCVRTSMGICKMQKGKNTPMSWCLSLNKIVKFTFNMLS